MRTLFEADALTIRLGELAVLREAAAYDVLDGDGRAVGSIVQDVGSVGNVVGRLLSIDRVPSISFAIRDRDGSALALLTRRRARGLLPRVRIGLALANGTEVVSAITRGTSRSSFRGVDRSEAPLADITLSPPALFEVRGADGAAVGRRSTSSPPPSAPDGPVRRSHADTGSRSASRPTWRYGCSPWRSSSGSTASSTSDPSA